MRILPFLCLVTLAGCASGAAGGVRAPARIVPGGGGDATVYVEGDRSGVSSEIPAPIDSVWPALISAYQELDLPITAMISSSHSLGSAGYTLTYQLKGERLSTYFDCGTDLSGDAADHSRVTIDIQSQLIPSDSGTVLHTVAAAEAKPLRGTGAVYAGCNPTGRLAARIEDFVRQALSSAHP